MDIKKYGQDVCNYIDSLNDDEFYELLLESGLERCPFVLTISQEEGEYVESKGCWDFEDFSNEFPSNILKVA